MTSNLKSLLLINLIFLCFACGKDSTDSCASKNCPPSSTCVNGDCICDNSCYALNPTNNKCEIKDCGSAGACNGGDCICYPGYEKDLNGKCNTEVRAKLIGNYSFVEVCASGTYTGTASITIDPGFISSIHITNFAGTAGTITATVFDDSQIFILNTTSGSYVLTSVISNYNISTGVFTFTYNLSDNAGNSESCTSTWTKL